MSDPLDGYLNLGDAAAQLGIHPNSLRRLIKHGTIDFAIKISGAYYVPRDRLTSFAQTYSGRPGPKGGRLRRNPA